MKIQKAWIEVIKENFSYKIVALFIALILWLTILGRRDFVFTKIIEVELLTSPQYTVAAQTTDRIRVRVSGPRASLKKFMDSTTNQVLILDISQRGEGLLDVDIPSNKIEVPHGVKVLSVRPNVIRAEVVKGNE